MRELNPPEAFPCDPTSSRERPSLTTSLPTKRPSAGSSPNCKDMIQWSCVLSRGGFCPKERRFADGPLALHRELEVAYCRLVTISTDNIVQSNENRSGIGAHWPFLSDAARIIQKDLDIAEYTDPVHNPMIPHVFVLEPDLVIYKIYSGYWFFGRPTMEERRQDLRAVIKKRRPAWDITTPELKAAWQQGRKELFYPYGKSYVLTLGERD